MANGEIVKQETTALSLDFGTLSLEGLGFEILKDEECS